MGDRPDAVGLTGAVYGIGARMVELPMAHEARLTSHKSGPLVIGRRHEMVGLGLGVISGGAKPALQL
jgi:hypothetical protein